MPQPKCTTAAAHAQTFSLLLRRLASCQETAKNDRFRFESSRIFRTNVAPSFCVVAQGVGPSVLKYPWLSVCGGVFVLSLSAFGLFAREYVSLQAGIRELQLGGALHDPHQRHGLQNTRRQCLVRGYRRMDIQCSTVAAVFTMAWYKTSN